MSLYTQQIVSKTSFYWESIVLLLTDWHSDWTSRPAFASKSRCSVYKLRQKYKCEKRASNIALSYGIDVDKWSFDGFTSLCLYL